MTGRVLVTGASGFIGRSVLEPLRARGFEVHAASHGEPPVGADGCTWHQSDLLEVGSRRRLLEAVAPTHLLHLAWYAVPGSFWTAPENFLWLEASLDLIAASREMRVVMAGSCAEYDWSRGGLCRENDICRPATPYGQAKLALQQALFQSGHDAAWGRIFFPFGPHEPPSRLVPSVVRALLKGQPARCSHGAQVRDFLYVEDLGDAFATLLDSRLQGPVNMASGEERSIRSLVEAIQSRLGGVVRFGDLAAPDGEPARLAADATRLRKELGWKPRVGLEAGLDRSVAWWQLEETAQRVFSHE